MRTVEVKEALSCFSCGANLPAFEDRISTCTHCGKVHELEPDEQSDGSPGADGKPEIRIPRTIAVGLFLRGEGYLVGSGLRWEVEYKGVIENDDWKLAVGKPSTSTETKGFLRRREVEVVTVRRYAMLVFRAGNPISIEVPMRSIPKAEEIGEMIEKSLGYETVVDVTQST